MTADELRAEALAGPWEAVLADRHGHVVAASSLRDEFDADDLGDVRIDIVRLSAAPPGPDAFGDRRLPGFYASADHLVSWDGFEEYDEVEARWVQAEAMVTGLNSAAAR